MSDIFEEYSAYYDLLYEDKDYEAECDYIQSLWDQYSDIPVKAILDLGCGTGVHAALLARKGYQVLGIDLSAKMLELAMKLLADMPNDVREKLSFARGDMRHFRAGRRFDVVVSLFDVISYQVTNSDLQAAFATARHHLNPGGVFIFDCWYGPAVLTDRPAVRVKRLENKAIQVIRTAKPVLYPNENCVCVHYHILAQDKNSVTAEEIREVHKMRYLFCPEIDNLLEENGLERIGMHEWMTGREPGFETWGVCFIGRA